MKHNMSDLPSVTDWLYTNSLRNKLKSKPLDTCYVDPVSTVNPYCVAWWTRLNDIFESADKLLVWWFIGGAWYFVVYHTVMGKLLYIGSLVGD